MENTSAPTELKKVAFQYFEMGLCVFPLTNFRKHPIFDWTPWKTQLPTHEQMEQWFSDSKLTGIGLLCGSLSGIGVVDDDSYKSGTPLPISSAVEVSSASGGRHMYFRCNPEVMNTNRFVAGYHGEVKNQGVIVVLPPSRVKNKQGNIGEYRWLKGDIAELRNLPELKPKMLEPLIAGKINERPKLSELVKTSEGARHDNFILLCHNILKRFSPKEWETSSVVDFLKLEASKFDPPHPPDDVERVINDVMAFRLEKRLHDKSYPNWGEGEMSYDPAWDGKSSGNDVNRSVSYQFNPQKLEELSVEEYGVDYLWDGFIAKGRISILAAFAKTGKTTLLTHLIKQMGAGGELAGRFVVPTKVLILSEENPSDWVERKKELGLGDNVRMQCYPVLGSLSENEWYKLMGEVLEYCQREDVEMVIFDTISGMWSVEDENSSVQINKAFHGLRLLAKNDLAVLLVHHTTKKENKGGRAVRGSGAINANCDFIAEFDRNGTSGTQRKLKVISRLQKEFIVTIELMSHGYMVVGNAKRPSWESNANALLTLLPLQGEGLTITQLHQMWDESILGKKPDPRTVRRYIEELLKRGRAITGEKKKVGKTMADSYLKAPIA